MQDYRAKSQPGLEYITSHVHWVIEGAAYINTHTQRIFSWASSQVQLELSAPEPGRLFSQLHNQACRSF